MDKGDLGAERQQAAARDLGDRNSQMSERWRASAADEDRL
jgi:hypothetical protein